MRASKLIPLMLMVGGVAQADTIQRRLAPPIARVQVTQDSIDGVKYRADSEGNRKTSEQTLAANAVESIDYDPVPESFRAAQALIEAGELERALDALARAASEPARAPVAAFVLLTLARTQTRAFYAGRGEAAAAVASYRSLVTTHPESRLVPIALREQGALLAAAGDGPGAAAAFAELSRFGERRRLGTGVSLAARYAEATAWLDLGDLDKADLMLRELIEGAPAKESLDEGATSIVAQARVARTLVLLARGKLDDAQKQFEALAQEHDLPGDARAWCLIGLGEVSARREAWGAAELAFTRVRVLHFDVPEACARATYDLGLAQKARAQGNAAALAAAAARFREVLERYGDTRYAALARREIP
jgi:outer membrane protein assembly factor BamD (BamD/ComL family)